MTDWNFTLSIVILSHNEKAETLRCLESLSQFTDERSEIILVDNASIDDTVSVVRQRFPSVKTFCLPENLGVAPARNFGIYRAAGKYIMTLDNDTIYHGPEPISKIEGLFSSLPSVGVLGFRLLNEDGSIQRNFRRFPSPLQPFVARISWLQKIRFLRRQLHHHLMSDIDPATIDDVLEVDYVIGANQIFLKDLFTRLGQYDRRMFYGPEDCEFCLRAKKQGYRNYYSTSVSIAHLYKRRSRHSLRLLTAHLSSFAYMFVKHKRFFSLYP